MKSTNQGIRTVIYPVKDIAQAKALYSFGHRQHKACLGKSDPYRESRSPGSPDGLRYAY
jgi:hypothetical protein